jgi:predicted esterase
MLKKPDVGQAVEVADLVAVGDAPPWTRPPGRLEVPAVEDGAPAPGRRVGHHLVPSGAGIETPPAALLYLPSDWQPGGIHPVVVEYPGNIFFTAGCYSTGRPEQCVMGYGMTRGRGAIWISLPFVDAAGHVAENGWGDPDATADFCVRAVEDVCERFGGDRDRLVLTGFSRGAIACGFIGLRNDRIAALWMGLHCCQHYDGDGWNGATLDGALERAGRFRGTSVFHTDNSADAVKPITEALGVPTTFVSSGLGAHSCAMFLDDRESTKRVRTWFENLTAAKSSPSAPGAATPRPR